jgi:hypothetical protein
MNSQARVETQDDCKPRNNMKRLAMNYRCNFSCSDSHAGMSENNFDERAASTNYGERYLRS